MPDTQELIFLKRKLVLDDSPRYCLYYLRARRALQYQLFDVLVLHRVISERRQSHVRVNASIVESNAKLGGVQAQALSDQDVVSAVKRLDQTGNRRVDLGSKVPFQIDLQVQLLDGFRVESSRTH